MRFIYSLLFIISLTFVLTLDVSAQIYKWVDAKGVQHFSNQPPPKNISNKIRVETVNLPTYKKYQPAGAIKLSSDKKVTIYSTVWCGICKKAKRYFQQNNIAYTEYDIEKSFQAKYRFNKMGGKGVPLILIGDQKMTGFDIDKFKQLYGS